MYETSVGDLAGLGKRRHAGGPVQEGVGEVQTPFMLSGGDEKTDSNEVPYMREKK